MLIGVRRRLLAGIVLLCWGCGSDVIRSPGDGEGGEAPSAPTLTVEVVRITGEPLGELDILVHDESGSLRSRHVSSLDGLAVAAAPGDMVSVIWRHVTIDGPWRLDAIRVTEEMERARFILHAPPSTSDNPPIRLTVTQASASALTRYSVLAECLPAVSSENLPVTLENDAYVGCPSSPTSFVYGMGYGADRLQAFDYAEVSHVPDGSAAITFPTTSVGSRAIDITVAAPSYPSVHYLEGSTVWSHRGWRGHNANVPGLPIELVPAPLTIPVELPTLPIGTVAAELRLVDMDVCTFSTATQSATTTWNPVRLRIPLLDETGSSYRIGEARPERGMVDVGDAVTVRAAGRRFHLPAPTSSEKQALPALEIPPDLPQTFEDDGGAAGRPQIVHDDRAEDDGYVAYVERGVGDMGGFVFSGESRTSEPCATE